jgi:hypothetical protein
VSFLRSFSQFRHFVNRKVEWIMTRCWSIESGKI